VNDKTFVYLGLHHGEVSVGVKLPVSRANDRAQRARASTATLVKRGRRVPAADQRLRSASAFTDR
jgi:hypothetical protein